MFTVNELILSPDGITFEPWATLAVVVVVLDDDPQPVATRATATTGLSQRTRRKSEGAPRTREPEHRPSILFCNRIPEPLFARTNLTETALPRQPLTGHDDRF
jgi:hypothetical protein